MSRSRALDFRAESRMIVKQLYPGNNYKAIRVRALTMIDNAKTDHDILRVLKQIREEAQVNEQGNIRR